VPVKNRQTIFAKYKGNVSELTPESKTGVEPAKVLVEDCPSRDQLQTEEENSKKNCAKNLHGLNLTAP
jgi:hypothetical protein